MGEKSLIIPCPVDKRNSIIIYANAGRRNGDNVKVPSTLSFKLNCPCVRRNLSLCLVVYLETTGALIERLLLFPKNNGFALFLGTLKKRTWAKNLLSFLALQIRGFIIIYANAGRQNGDFYEYEYE